jgi:hypothetical protein
MRRLLITGSAVRVRPREPKSRVWAALVLAACPIFAQASNIVALCTVSTSGDFRCYDTGFSAPEYVDCTDGPEPPIGSTSERGGGVIEWGNVVAGRFKPEGRAVYEWSGRQAQAGGVAFALVGVDEDRIYGDGMDRLCRQGRFWE